MIRDKKTLTKTHEGFKKEVYYDSLGFVTGGYGCLLDPRKKASLPAHIWEIIFEYQYGEHEELMNKLQPWITQIGEVRNAIMLDMHFNLGPEPFNNDGFKDWPIFINQVKTGQYLAAAANMRATLWYKQVGIRGETLARMMETNEWP